MEKINEILNILQEECAEVIQVISKCRRFGIDNSHKDGITQRQKLTQEIGDVSAMISLLIDHGVVSVEDIEIAEQAKFAKLKLWSNIYN